MTTTVVTNRSWVPVRTKNPVRRGERIVVNLPRASDLRVKPIGGGQWGLFATVDGRQHELDLGPWDNPSAAWDAVLDILANLP